MGNNLNSSPVVYNQIDFDKIPLLFNIISIVLCVSLVFCGDGGDIVTLVYLKYTQYLLCLTFNVKITMTR